MVEIFLRLSISVSFVCIAAMVAMAAGKAGRMTGLLENEDCTSFFDSQTFPPGKAGEITDRYVDVLAGAGVTVLFCNTNARRTNYPSKVWQAFWDGYDPDGPDDQPFLAGLPEDQRKHYRKRIHKIFGFHQQGVDYPARMIGRCRHNGISPWISLRMNDVHCNDNLAHPFHGDLWRKPEYFRKGHPGYYARALDYAHPEVRDHYRALIVETLERYDVDGLELDFMREPYLFSKGEEQAGSKILTQWLRDVRQLVEKAAADRKHPIQLAVRVPADPDTTLALGLDAPTWAKEGLVELVIVAPRWGTLRFDMPLGKWRSLLGDKVTLAGGLDVNYQPYPGAPRRVVDPEYAAGAAVSVLSGGGDIVYLFNYFQHSLSWTIPGYQRTLKAFTSLDKACKLPRRHGVTYRDVVVPGEVYKPPLPASGRSLSFDLPLGPKPPADWQAEAIIEVAPQEGDAAAPAVSVNGVATELRNTEALQNKNRLLTYTVPLSALPGENSDTISITAPGDKPIKVLRVEVRLAPPHGQ